MYLNIYIYIYKNIHTNTFLPLYIRVDRYICIYIQKLVNEFIGEIMHKRAWIFQSGERLNLKTEQHFITQSKLFSYRNFIHFHIRTEVIVLNDRQHLITGH
jgi:hypothetical protein